MNKDEGAGLGGMCEDEGTGRHKINKAETEGTKYEARTKAIIVSQAKTEGTKHKAGTGPIVILKAESKDAQNGNIPAKPKKLCKEDITEMNKDEGTGRNETYKDKGAGRHETNKAVTEDTKHKAGTKPSPRSWARRTSLRGPRSTRSGPRTKKRPSRSSTGVKDR